MGIVSSRPMVFVTGASGILGTRLVFDLLVQGEKVRALRRMDSDIDLVHRIIRFYNNGADITDLIDRLEWVEGDVLDITSLESYLEDCDYCYHSAAMVSFHPRDHEIMNEVNATGTANIVNACIEKGTRLLHVSSVAAIGRTSASESLDESDIWKDSPYNSGYALSKYRAEMEVWRGVEEGLSAVIVNPTIILGAGDSSRSSGTLFGAVLKGLRFYTDGGASVVDVRDVSAVSIEIAKSDIEAERFILNSASVLYRSVFDEIADRLGKSRASIRIKPWLINIAWRILAVKDLIFRTKSSLTKETAQSSMSSYQYSSDKVEEVIGRKLIDWKEAVSYHASFYR